MILAKFVIWQWAPQGPPGPDTVHRLHPLSVGLVIGPTDISSRDRQHGMYTERAQHHAIITADRVRRSTHETLADVFQ